jgi:hypothetical protein
MRADPLKIKCGILRKALDSPLGKGNRPTRTHAQGLHPSIHPFLHFFLISHSVACVPTTLHRFI